MMTFPIYGKIKNGNQTTNQICSAVFVGVHVWIPMELGMIYCLHWHLYQVAIRHVLPSTLHPFRRDCPAFERRAQLLDASSPSRSSRIKRLTLDAAGFSATKGGCQISCGENHQWTTRFPGNGKHSNPFLVMFGGWFMVLFSSNIVTIFDVDRLEHVGCLIVDGVLGWWSMWENCSKFEFGTSRSRNIILETDLTITCSNYINIFYKVVPPPCIKLVDNPHELYRYNPLKPQL